jgi:four helix bundle protein
MKILKSKRIFDNMAHPWKDLIVWQKSHSFVLEVYKITNDFPEKERYGLVQQLRRSAISIAANVVEGKSKKTDKEFSSFLYNSRGSLEETRYHLLLSKDLEYIDKDQYMNLENLATEISFLLNKLIGSVSK